MKLKKLVQLVLLMKIFQKRCKTIYIALDDDARKEAYMLGEFFSDIVVTNFSFTPKSSGYNGDILATTSAACNFIILVRKREGYTGIDYTA